MKLQEALVTLYLRQDTLMGHGWELQSRVELPQIDKKVTVRTTLGRHIPKSFELILRDLFDKARDDIMEALNEAPDPEGD